MAPGLYRVFEREGAFIALVVAVGQLQLKYVRIEYPVVPHIIEIEYFAQQVQRSFDTPLDKAARDFLRTTPCVMGEVDSKVMAILEDLAGYTLLT